MEPNIVPPSELTENGVLLEINRRLLHPIGLALQARGDGLRIVRSTEPGGPSFKGVVARVESKLSNFAALRASTMIERLHQHGWIVEPLIGSNDLPLVLSVDDETIGDGLERGMRFAEANRERMSDLTDEEFAALLLEQVLTPFVAGAVIEDGGVVRVLPKVKREPEEEKTLSFRAYSRALYVARELLVLNTERVVSFPQENGRTLHVRRLPQLLPDEIVASNALAEEFFSWVFPTQMPPIEKALAVCRELGRFFSLAQPGMGILRDETGETWRKQHALQLDAVRAFNAKMADVDAFLARRRPARDLKDRDEVRKIIEGRAEPLRERQQHLLAELTEIGRSLAPLENALSRLEEA